MPRLILLAAAALVIYILYQRVQSKPKNQRRGEYIKLGLGIAVVAVVGLTLAGKMHWVGAAATGLLVALRQMLPTLLRFFPMLSSLRGQSSSVGGQQSRVETDILRMELDHDSGRLDGEVLAGEFSGSRLHDLDRPQLDSLLAYCQSRDPESGQLLLSYLQNRFGEESHYASGGARPGATDMNRKEALEILGLKDDAKQEAIVAAHRSLMQKLHPDRGGNDYLAAKINQAKDVLLG